MSNLIFQNTTLTVVPHNNQTYITATDLAMALQYSDVNAVNRIYTRHSDEFTDDMSCSVNLTDLKMPQYEQRIFSLRGAHLIAMFSRTKIAKEFRKWVLDILDKEVKEKTQEIRPLVEEPKPDVILTHKNATNIAKYLVRARAFAKEVETFHRKLHEELGIPRYVRNDLATKGYDIAHGFNTWLDPFITEVLPETTQIKRLPHTTF